nr:unnamed protein product [Callosobruchus analis]
MSLPYLFLGKLEIIRLPQERIQEGLEVLEAGFYPHESVCRALGIASAAEAVDDLNRLCVGVAKDGVSMIAVDKTTNKVAGVAFNKLQVYPKLVITTSIVCPKSLGIGRDTRGFQFPGIYPAILLERITELTTDGPGIHVLLST